MFDVLELGVAHVWSVFGGGKKIQLEGAGPLVRRSSPVHRAFLPDLDFGHYLGIVDNYCVSTVV